MNYCSRLGSPCWASRKSGTCTPTCPRRTRIRPLWLFIPRVDGGKEVRPLTPTWFARRWPSMTSDLWAREVPRKARKEVTELDIFGLLTLSAMQTQRMRRSFYCPSGLSPITRQSMCKSTSLMSCTQMLGGTMKLSCICATSSLCFRTTLQVVSTSRLVFATWNLILFIFD